MADLVEIAAVEDRVVQQYQDQLRERFTKRLTDMYPESDPSTAEILFDCGTSSELFGHTFQQGLFSRRTLDGMPISTRLDQRMHECVDDDNLQKTAFIGTRGIGKTTKLISATTQRIVYRRCKYVMFVAESADVAIQKTENLKSELVQSYELRETFGKLRSKTYDDLAIRFSTECWYIADPTTGAPFCVVMPRGSNQTVRGMQTRLPIHGYDSNGEWGIVGSEIVRPDWIPVDDLMKDDEVQNPDIRSARTSWVADGLCRCTEQYDPSVNWRIFWAESFKHEDHPIEHFVQDPEWHGERLPICDENLKSFAPEIMTTAELNRQFEAADTRPEGAAGFYREVCCLPVPTKGAQFPREVFQFYDPAVEEFDWGSTHTVMTVDPAKTKNKRACDTGIAIATFDYPRRRIYGRQVVSERMDVSKLDPSLGKSDDKLQNVKGLVDWMEDLIEAYELVRPGSPAIIGVETTGIEDWIKHPMMNHFSRKGIPVEWVWLKARKEPGIDAKGRDAAKIARVGKLAYYFRTGQVWLNKAFCQPLIQCLMSYPNAQKWDAGDAFSYMIGMMAVAEKYFQAETSFESEEASEKELFGEVCEPVWSMERDVAVFSDDIPGGGIYQPAEVAW